MSRMGNVTASMAVLLALVAGCGRERQAPAPPPPGTALPVGALVVTARTEQVATRIDVIGTTYSTRQINLSARIASYVKDVLASAGGHVKQGQVLMTLDDREILEQIAPSASQMTQA